MLNKEMNEAMSVINALPAEEREMFIYLSLHDVVNKDSMLKDLEKGVKEIPCVLFCNNDQKPKGYNALNIRKDKAKAGYHNGARKQGFGSCDKWGKPEKLTKDQDKDFKAQMAELNDLPDDITINEAVNLLTSIYDLFYFGGFDMGLVQCHKSEWYDNLEENISMVETVYQEYVNKLKTLQIDLYQSTEELFPEMGMGFQNKVVDIFNEIIHASLSFRKRRMIRWVVNRYKDNREHEKRNEEFRHNAEIIRLNKLMEEAEKYLK